MKFLLKVLVLVFLVVISKLAKDGSVEGEKQVAGKTEVSPVFTGNIQQSPIAEKQRAAISVKFEKGSLQIN